MIGCLGCGRRNNFPYCLDCRDKREAGKPASECSAGEIWKDEMDSIKSRMNPAGNSKRCPGRTPPDTLDKQ